MDREGAGVLKDEMRRHGEKPQKSIKKVQMMDFLEGKRVLMPQPVAPGQHQRVASVAPAPARLPPAPPAPTRLPPAPPAPAVPRPANMSRAPGRRRGCRKGRFSTRELLTEDQKAEYASSELKNLPSFATVDLGSDVLVTAFCRNRHGFFELALGEGLSSQTKPWRLEAASAQSQLDLAKNKLRELEGDQSEDAARQREQLDKEADAALKACLSATRRVRAAP